MNAPLSLSLRALARLLSYPDDALRANLDALRQALHREGAIGRARRQELDALVEHIARQDALDAEADYVQLFDSGRRTSLYLFEHVHGDSRDRGPAMIDLAQTYEAAGLYLSEGEMPDHLPVVLEYASTQPPAAARAFLAEMAHILDTIHGALARRRSPYAAALAALVELAGESVSAATPAADTAAEPGVDEAWAEPAAFGGCDLQGQSRTGQPQPVHIVRAAARHAAPGAQP